jgi:membrane-bound lytic murein transglycosylase D
MGARGLWQLMPSTARRYGLRVDDVEDDRLDISRSTDAAARYLHDLYMQFGDWKLALAAYNDGEANVGFAILRAQSQDFDKLSSMRLLPIETITYVPRVFAAMRSTSQSLSLDGYHGSATSTTVFASTKH